MPTLGKIKIVKNALLLSTQKQKDPWYIDSGCSKHITEDKDKSLSISKSIRADNNVDIESSPTSKEEFSDTIKECSVIIYPMEEVEEESCHELEAEVVNLRKKVEKSNTQIKFLNSSMTLDEIFNS